VESVGDVGIGSGRGSHVVLGDFVRYHFLFKVGMQLNFNYTF